jgi:hypothetical protein
MALSLIPIEEIEVEDQSVQPRTEVQHEVILRYAEVWESASNGDYPFNEPVELVCDGSRYWIGDGWYRVLSGIRTRKEFVQANVRNGTREDAMLYAASCNHTHGQPTTSADKRRAVEMVLTLKPAWSDKQVAEHCRVSYGMVSSVRDRMSQNGQHVEHATKITPAPTKIGKAPSERKPRTPREPREEPVISIGDSAALGKALSCLAELDSNAEHHFKALARLMDDRLSQLSAFGKAHNQYHRSTLDHLRNAFDTFLVWRRLS